MQTPTIIGGDSRPLRAFISYSTADKLIAGQIKAILHEYGIDAFIAHEDIHVSQKWKDRIIQELAEARIFIPVLSSAFKESEWAPQEVGLAFGRDDILFVPLSIDGTVPFGFIAHIQGKRISDDGVRHELLIDPIVERFPHAIFPEMIKRLAGAASFRGAEALMQPLVPHFTKFNDDEIHAFAEASIKNGQIWNAADCATEYLPKFIEIHRTRMAADKLKALSHQVKNREWYRAPDVDKMAGTKLSDEAKAIISEVSKDPNGLFLYVRTLGGTSFQANGENLCADQSARSVARWKSGMENLVAHGILVPQGSKGEVFALTAKGYEIADVLHED